MPFTGYSPSSGATIPLSRIFVQVYSLVLGHSVLVILSVIIITHRLHSLALLNLLYVLLVAGLMLARFIEMRYDRDHFEGSQHKKLGRWGRFSMRVSAVYACLWMVVQALSRVS